MDRRKILLAVAVVIATLGAGLVFVYAQSAESRAAEQFDMVEVLVATEQIDPGESAAEAAQANKIVVSEVPRDSVLPDATDDGNDFRDTFALTTIYPGEQLITDKFGAAEDVQAEQTLPTPNGLIAISLQLEDPQRVAGFARPGSRAAIFATTEASTFAVAADVLVLGTGSATQIGEPDPVDPEAPEGEGSTAEQVPLTLLTVAVTQEQAERALYWDENALSVSFALMNKSDDVVVDEAAASPPGGSGVLDDLSTAPPGA